METYKNTESGKVDIVSSVKKYELVGDGYRREDVFWRG